jgi:hypothetical protein
MDSREQIRLILKQGRDGEKSIASQIPHWRSEAERLLADLQRQQMRGASTRATGAAAAVLIDVVKEEREAFRRWLTEPGTPPDVNVEEIEQACEAVLGSLKVIETDADATRERLIR